MRTKRMPLFLMACFALFLGLATQSCVDEYDDSALTGRVDDLENRVESLERLCQQLNSNIEAVRTLAEAAQNNVSITSITPLTENGVEVGYVIEFTQGDPITIYHGQDGFTPVIGVKMDTNGIYYWTLNGEWLTDEAGNKVKAVGTDGKDGQDGTPGAPGQDGEDGKDGEDGITPQLKIENGRWLLSMDNGKTWQDLGPATGADGQDGKDGEDGEDGKDGTDGDSFFKSVDYTSSPDYVLFTLADGTTLKIPTWYAFDNLRALCDQFNKDIQALQAIVEVLQAKDEVTSVEPLLENGDEVGYTIYFEKHSPINIYHGKNGQDGQDGQDGTDGTDGTDGKDGVSPMIGVRQDTDGIYYWTLNGEWLTDETGNKIKAQGTDGADGTDGTDGATPRLKIGEDGYWYISYSGNDDDWTQLGKATGENGQDGQPGQDGQDGDSFFKNLTEDEDYVYLTLASDDSTIAVPKHKPMSISFSETEDIRVLPSQTYPIQYTITGATDKTVIKALAQDGFRAEVKPTDTSTGTIEITTPSTILSSEVLVFVTDGEERTIMRSINFVEGVINITNRSYTVAYMGGRVDVELSTNIDYTVEIPAEDQSWISLVPASRVVMRDETVSFMIAQNNSTQLRYSIIKLVDKLGVTSETIQISQRGGSSQDLHVETAGGLEQLISKEDAQIIEELKLTGHLNTFDYEFLKTMPNLKTVDLSELDDETIPASAFSGSKVTTVLLPLNLKTISSRAFFQSAITSVYIPETVESIGENAFAETASLTGNVTIPGSVATIGSYAFYQSTFSSLTLNEGIETIGSYAFYQCTEATSDLVIPNSVTEMGTYAFAESTFTGSLTIGNGLSIIPDYAFQSCTSFTGNITIGENVKEIGDYAFERCSGFTGNLVIPDKVETIGDRAFYSCTGFKGYLSIGSNVKNIGERAFTDMVSGALNFSKVYCKAPTPPEIDIYTGRNPFGAPGSSYPTHLLVPIGLSQTYRQSDWENFEIIEEVEF